VNSTSWFSLTASERGFILTTDKSVCICKFERFHTLATEQRMGSRAINDDVEMTTLQLDVSHSIAPNKGARAIHNAAKTLHS